MALSNEAKQQHAKFCAPDQSWDIKAVEAKPSQENYDEAFRHMLKIGIDEGLAKTFSEHELNIVIAPWDSPACSLSTASEYPIANILLGRYRLKEELNRPFGLAAMALPHNEGSLLQFMSAYHAKGSGRVIAERLLKSDEFIEHLIKPIRMFSYSSRSIPAAFGSHHFNYTDPTR
ncbi:hypothetical protein HJFPF1_10556 [Paramyrothecium foliicola]|nr:hypothetical protein HJFPF1_10556 [Paramyrothecium foliicola]